MTPAELRKLEDELLARMAARESIAEWIKYRDVGIVPARHHELIIAELEKVEKGETTRLMLALPPGSAKSTYTSVEFPPWFIGRNPKASIIAASHTLDLAERFGRKARNIVASREFKNVFDFGISEDSQAAGKWETTTGAEYFAVGVGGSVTGRRADCLLGNTLIMTDNGAIKIEEAKVGQHVLAQHENRPVYRRIVAVARRFATEYWRIRTAAGNVVEATGNHRIRVGQAWKQASSVVDGDVLLRVLRGEFVPPVLRTGEEVSSKPYLQAGVQYCLRNENDERISRDERIQTMRQLRESNGNEKYDLLCEVPVGNSRKEGGEEQDYRATELRRLREGISSSQQHVQVENLFPQVQERSSLGNAEGREESRLEGRSYGSKGAGQYSARIQAGEEERPEEGLVLRELHVHGGFGGPPHQPQSDGQLVCERGDSLPQVPHGASLGAQEQTTVDFVSMVERVRCPEGILVYDIEVEEAHNFYANGILVHNCGIIDDPVKGREDADSERSRETVWQWYLNDFLTRLKPGARQVVIQTRWHEDDLAGRILQREAHKWRVINIPMIAETDDDPLGRKPGERLWPEWFTDEMVADAQRDVRSWNALYQQNPVPEEGNFFKKEWFIEYGDGDLPTTLHKYGSSDFAVTDRGGDFTEHAVWGVDFGGDLWLLDYWYGQTGPDRWIEEMCNLILAHKPQMWFGEAGPIRRAVEPFLRKRMDARGAYCNIEWLASINDKATRARAFQALASMGKVKIPKDKPWIARVMSQWLQFPAGRVDDAVDAASLIGRGLEFTRSATKKMPIQYPPLAIP